jgi:hypothetical protein
MTTPFGLLGHDENALTYALGFTFAKCPQLLQIFLRRIGLGGISLNTLQSATIRLQQRGHGIDGITDIEIDVPGQRFLIVEAKVGLSVPDLEQCRKYLPRFDAHVKSQKRLIALVESGSTAFVHQHGSLCPALKPLLKAFHWSDIIPECARLRSKCQADTEEGVWLRYFQGFLEQEYQMRAFTEEVWIVSARTSPLWPGGLSYYDTHAKERPQGHRIYYRTDCHGKRPLYMAFRNNGKVTHIQRVMGVVHEAMPLEYVPELRHISAKQWPTTPHTIWLLGPPTELSRPIPTGDNTMRARQFSCDLDILISSNSIREAVQKMKDRRRDE